jgi:hypothetical protein
MLEQSLQHQEHPLWLHRVSALHYKASLLDKLSYNSERLEIPHSGLQGFGETTEVYDGIRVTS